MLVALVVVVFLVFFAFCADFHVILVCAGNVWVVDTFNTGYNIVVVL